jgi:hypothetical protein
VPAVNEVTGRAIVPAPVLDTRMNDPVIPITELTALEWDILRACNGEIVHLPYNGLQREAEEKLERLGLIIHYMEDDQPTAGTTVAGKALLDRRNETYIVVERTPLGGFHITQLVTPDAKA